AGVPGVLELLGESRHRSGEAQVLAGAGDRRGFTLGDRPLDQLAGATLRRLVAQAQPGDLAGLALLLLALRIAQRFQPALGAYRYHFIQGRDGMPGADLAGIDLVVAEVLALQGPVL